MKKTDWVGLTIFPLGILLFVLAIFGVLDVTNGMGWFLTTLGVLFIIAGILISSKLRVFFWSFIEIIFLGPWT